MAAAKLNVLHWHLSDMQSFPFNSSVHPKLAQYGAYDPVHAIYTHEDVRTVVKFATARGIRVVPEFVSRRLSGVAILFWTDTPVADLLRRTRPATRGRGSAAIQSFKAIQRVARLIPLARPTTNSWTPSLAS